VTSKKFGTTNKVVKPSVGKKYATTAMGSTKIPKNRNSSLDSVFKSASGDILQTQEAPFFSPYLSTDMLELPRTNREKRRWYRHFYKNDPIVGPAIDLHSEIPLSKITLSIPKAKNYKTAQKILRFYEAMVTKINLFQKLLSISHEYNLIGDVYIFSEWDDELKAWSDIKVLDPDTVEFKKYPFTDYTEISIIPDPATRELIERANHGDQGALKALKTMPPDIVEYVKRGQNIPLDTDPYSGSHVYHLARKMSDYEEQGTSILDRVVRDLLEFEKLRQAQTQIATRNMTPKRIVFAEGLSEDDVEGLREQVEASMIDPDYSIITNYELNWQEIGSNDRLLVLDSEYGRISTRLMSGLGVTAELLSGEATYSGAKITLEVLNTRYLLFREVMQNFVEEVLFKPVAKANGFVEVDEDGNERLIYPELSFRRLALRDSNDTFEALYSLYQKGSVDISTILDLLNLDPIATRERLESDMGTVNDSAFNDLLRGVYQNVAQDLVGKTNITERFAKYMNLKYNPEAAGGMGGGMGGMGLGGDMGGPDLGLGGGEMGGDMGMGMEGGELGGEGGGMAEATLPEVDTGGGAEAPAPEPAAPEPEAPPA